MAKLTRRKMLWTSSASVATLGGVAALLAGVNHQSASAAAPKTSSAAAQISTSASGSMIAYVSDVTKGEVRLMMGEKEFVMQDSALVQHMLNSAH